MAKASKFDKIGAADHDFFKSNGEDHRFFTTGPSMTRQEFADEADINVLMQRFERTGVMPSVDGTPPVYVDYTEMPPDLMHSMEILHNAEAAFMQLPAKVRKEFDNSPFAFVDFASDPANLDQMRQWGLAPVPELPDAVRDAAAVVTPPAPESAPPEPAPAPLSAAPAPSPRPGAGRFPGR
jgi:hypothetical protein